MARNIVKFCAAALAGSIIGITYERMPPTSRWPDLLKSVSADVLVPKTPQNDDITSRKAIMPNLDPAASAENLKHSSRYGLPSSDNVRLFNDFILSYDRRLRAPVWVFEHLTPQKLKGEGKRERSEFMEDPAIHDYFRASLSDFKRSGYDRGHMAAAANHKINQAAMDQTFALSNISPQAPNFNRGAWNKLEQYVRFRANRAKNLYVVTGPLFLPRKAKDGNLYVTYRVLGSNHVGVPTHYFKVFLVEGNDGELSLEAFSMPNDDSLDESIDLNDYRVPIKKLDSIERAAGILFFSMVSRDKVKAPIHLASGFKGGEDWKKIPG